jgi:hypothetical protein
MGRRLKRIAAENALMGMPASLRKYWQECNRHDREVAAWNKARRKARDKKRRKCRCEAYPWPHRPGGGFCRHPDPPLQRWEPKTGGRPYRVRYAGLLRQIARANGLHPIRDRALIRRLMEEVLWAAKELHDRCPRKYKYRNMELAMDGNTIRVVANYQTAGPMM